MNVMNKLALLHLQLITISFSTCLGLGVTEGRAVLQQAGDGGLLPGDERHFLHEGGEVRAGLGLIL